MGVKVMNRTFLIVLFLIVLGNLSGCAGLDRKSAVPDKLTAKAVIPGLEDVRYRIGIDTEALKKEAIESFYREKDYYEQTSPGRVMPAANYLVISGGGDHGAYGAGLLYGWSKAGSRPDFKLVTGVSTGALTAPFAFLGSAYDEKLKSFYTNIHPEDILKERSIFAALISDAMADNSPLWHLIKKEINQDMMAKIANEYRKGRLLLIGTVDLDARQMVLWNMTRIAASKDPKALEIFRSVMIASASIPAAFPPVMFDVEVEGVAYQEMHVDGGTMAQLFMYPPGLHVRDISKQQKVKRDRSVYIIRNARLDAKWSAVQRQTMSIASRAISSLIQTQGIGDLFRAYLLAERDGVDYNLAYIPDDFSAPHTEEFDTVFMRALFQNAYDSAVQGYSWKKVPPGL
jgi:hypothetical protein